MASDEQHILCFWLLLAILPFAAFAQNPANISLGSSLSARDGKDSSWQSPSGDFAFGFQEIVKDGFLLSIWFNKISERTIVWFANGNKLAPRGSTVQVTSNGQLLLSDPNGNRIWSADSTGVAYAAMLDTGNFVLADKSSGILWQSFDNPTDTILPAQTLNQPNKLFSRYQESNYSNGRFQFKLQDDGNLVMYTTNFPLDSANFAYWTTQVFGKGFQFVFNQSAFICLRASNGSIIKTISSTAPSTQDFYQRATLEYDGVFRHYVYPKNSSSSRGKWPMSWSSVSFIPSDICLRITEQTGSGACGLNSYCQFSKGKICQCPPGYSFIDKNDEMKGCKKDFVPQSCDEASPETHLFDFHEMVNTDWPLSDYDHFQDTDEDFCRQVCLDDCFCDVAVFRNVDCWKKKIPLSNGRVDPTIVGKAPNFRLKMVIHGWKSI